MGHGPRKKSWISFFDAAHRSKNWWCHQVSRNGYGPDYLLELQRWACSSWRSSANTREDSHSHRCSRINAEANPCGTYGNSKVQESCKGSNVLAKHAQSDWRSGLKRSNLLTGPHIQSKSAHDIANHVPRGRDSFWYAWGIGTSGQLDFRSNTYWLLNTMTFKLAVKVNQREKRITTEITEFQISDSGNC